MKEFKNFREFENFLKEVIKSAQAHKTAFLEASAQYIEDDAKRKFGIYQEAAGSYPAWAELAEATKRDRIRKGFEPNNPLYRTGDLMHSIYHKVQGNEAVIGSDEDIMIYQELGTPGSAHPIPARPVLGPAAFQSKAKIEKIAYDAVKAWLTGQSPIKKKSVYSL